MEILFVIIAVAVVGTFLYVTHMADKEKKALDVRRMEYYK